MQYTNSPFFELAKNWRYINLKLRYSDFDLTYGWLIPCSFQLWKKSIFQKVANFPFIFWTGEFWGTAISNDDPAELTLKPFERHHGE